MHSHLNHPNRTDILFFPVSDIHCRCYLEYHRGKGAIRPQSAEETDLRWNLCKPSSTDIHSQRCCAMFSWCKPPRENRCRSVCQECLTSFLEAPVGINKMHIMIYCLLRSSAYSGYGMLYYTHLSTIWLDPSISGCFFESLSNYNQTQLNLIYPTLI